MLDYILNTKVKVKFWNNTHAYNLYAGIYRSTNLNCESA